MEEKEKEKQKIIQDENINKNKENEISKKDLEKKSLNKRDITIEIKDEDLINDKTKFENMNILEKKEEISNNKVNDDINNINIMNSNNIEQNNEKQNLEMQEEEDINNNNENNKDNEKYSLPKLNFDYDKNLNELLNDININQEKLFLKTPLDDDKSNILNNNIKDESSKNKNSSINSDTIKNIFQKKQEHKKNQQSPINYLKKNKVDANMLYDMKELDNEEEDNGKLINIKISNLQKNGYSELFSFNQDLNNLNNKLTFNTEEFPNKISKNIINEKKEKDLNINNKNNNVPNENNNK